MKSEISKKTEELAATSTLGKAERTLGTWQMLAFISASIILLAISGQISFEALVFSTILGVLSSVTSYLHYNNVISVNKGNLRYLPIISHHAIFILFIFFVVGIELPFIYLGASLVFLSHLWYGRRGAVISLLAQVTFISIYYVTNTSDPDLQTFATYFSVLTIFVYISIFLSEIIDLANAKITKLSAINTDKQIEHKRINSLINSMGDGVIVTDASGKIVNYNGAALDLVDTNETIGGKQLEKYLTLTDKDGNGVDLIADVKKHRRTINRDDLILALSKDDKTNLYVNISPILIGYGPGSEKGFTLILRDITNQKSLEEERDEFISVVSHELRTPIAITEGKISNAMLTNNNSKKDKKVGKSLSDAHEQTLFLASMINDLSTLARAERGALDMEISLIEPKKLMEEIKANYNVEAKQKGLKLEVKTAKDTPSIDNSRLYVQEILQNFVTNSLKYTQKGTITISAKKGAQAGSVAFSVKDTGIGVSTSDQKKLFEKFFRSEDYRTRESSGTGLGLHITQKLATKVNGKITVKSKLNSGSTFTLTVVSIKK